MLPLAETEPLVSKDIHPPASEKAALELVARIYTLSPVFGKSTVVELSIKGTQFPLSVEYSREGVVVNE